jgi:two-component system response regulator HydG
MKSEETILIVDDDSTHRFMLVAVLGSWGYDTCEADDGSTALEMIHGADFGLVLMDIRMRTLSGLEALAKLKAFNPGIPIILMSAYCSGEVVAQARKNGACALLDKPLHLGELRNAIEEALVQKCQHVVDLQSHIK